MNFKCPLCKKNNAKRSYAYPKMIVCDCSGELKEVGQFQEGEIKPIENEETLLVDNFFIEKIKNQDKLNEISKNLLIPQINLNNLKNNNIQVFLASYNGSLTHEDNILFYIKENKAFNFTSKVNKNISNKDINTILDKLKEKCIIH